MSDRETISVYDRRAEDYAAMNRREKPNPALVSFMELLGGRGHVLDLGCGPGASAAVMIASGFSVDAVDASQGMVDMARSANNVPARLGRFEDDYLPESHDGIWANFSLLHAPRNTFPALIAHLASALKPGGVFHIGMKTGVGEARDKIGRHYAYYSREELVAALEAAGLSIEREFTGEGAGLSGEVSPWIELQARKGGVSAKDSCGAATASL